MEKVAIVTSGIFPVPPTKGGAVENLIQMIGNQNQILKKLDLTIFSIDDLEARNQSKNIEDKYTKYRFIRIPWIVKFFNLLIYFFFCKIMRKKKVMSYRFIGQRIFYIVSVARILHKQDFDRVVLENHPTLFLCIKLFKNYDKYKNKYIYHMHNKLNGFYGCIKIIENTPMVIGVSNYILSIFKKQVPNYSSKTKFRVLRNKVDSSKFVENISDKDKLLLKKKLNLPLNKKIVLFSGRMNKEKGIDKLLLAWQKLDKKEVALLIVGSYYYKSGVTNSSFANRINTLIEGQKNIFFTGYINYYDMPKIYAIADLVVLPSMWEDPAPLTVIEALTSGKPLITTNSGGIPEYVINTGAITLVKEEPNFVSNLTTSIQKTISSSEILKEMSNKSKIATKNWNSKKYYLDFCKVININDLGATSGK